MKVYLSSTLKDLLEERKAVMDALGDECIVKHSYKADERNLRESCLAVPHRNHGDRGTERIAVGDDLRLQLELKKPNYCFEEGQATTRLMDQKGRTGTGTLRLGS